MIVNKTATEKDKTALSTENKRKMMLAKKLFFSGVEEYNQISGVRKIRVKTNGFDGEVNDPSWRSRQFSDVKAGDVVEITCERRQIHLCKQPYVDEPEHSCVELFYVTDVYVHEGKYSIISLSGAITEEDISQELISVHQLVFGNKEFDLSDCDAVQEDNDGWLDILYNPVVFFNCES